MEGIIDFQARLEGPAQHSRATSIFNQIVSHYEPFQTQKPYKQITLLRVTHEYAISQETFLYHFFLHIVKQLVRDGEPESESSYPQALAYFVNFDSWSPEQKDVLGTHLAAFADYLVKFFFTPMKASSLKTPQYTPAPLSGIQSVQQIAGSPQRLSYLRRDCLIRDHHRCVISLAFDKNEAAKRAVQDPINCKDDDDHLLTDESLGFEYLEVAHILPHSLVSCDDKNSELIEAKKSALGILNMFDSGVVHLIESVEIDRPGNALTLTQKLHHDFGAFKIYFEPVPNVGIQTQHVYKIESIEPDFLRDKLFPVTRKLLLAPNHTIDPPNPRFLAIHRAVVFILHLSGAGEYIDQILRDLEEVEVKEDGSTALGHLVGLRLDGWLNEIRVQ